MHIIMDAEQFLSWEFWACIGHGFDLTPKHARKHEMHPPWVKKREKKFCLDSNDCGFICAGVNFVGGYK